GLCRRFPAQALDFLSLVIGGQTQWLPRELDACLGAIRAAVPHLEADQRFERLRTHLHRHGRE
ncbi:MAG: hypothetical protein NNA22_09915, partial [Nitrospira sp.]|nr:hypothetical protein [Nitrospira sp.]